MKAHWIFTLAVIGIMSLPCGACSTRTYDDDVRSGCADSECVVQSCIETSFGSLQSNWFSLPALPAHMWSYQAPVIVKALPPGWAATVAGRPNTSLREAANLRSLIDPAGGPVLNNSIGGSL